MRILFFPIGSPPFYGKTLEERPIGGTETAVIRLSEALDALGHEVFVATAFKPVPPQKPIYLHMSMVNHLQDVDLLIVVRGLNGLLLPVQAKKRFFWSGDAWTSQHTWGIGDRRYIDKIDTFLAVSDWQAKTVCETSGFPFEKTFILRNGVKLSSFSVEEKRNPKRLIYTASPRRGIPFLPEIYQMLKKKHPDIELHLFTSQITYSMKWPPQPDYRIVDEHWINLVRDLPDCYYHGSILQSRLARELMQSSIFVYPTNFEETSCISAMEALAAGCVVISSDLAALKETVGDAGILLPGVPPSEEYMEKFVEKCSQILSNDHLREEYSRMAKKRAEGLDWHLRAQELIDFAQKQHGLS